MRIETYNPTDMSVLESDATGVDFGVAIKGQHSNVVAVRPINSSPDTNFLEIALFLENNAGLNHTQFGKFKSSTAIPGITAGSDYLSDYFVQVTGISDTSMISTFSGFGLLYNAANPEYTWIDAEAGLSETTIGDSNVNFRFVFEYN
jgi:hypothetical protein